MTKAPVPIGDLRDSPEGIHLDQDDLVIRHGFRSKIDQIRELKMAGINLAQYREERYAEPTGINVRMYGDIDRTVFQDKKNRLAEELVKRDEQRKTKAAEEADSLKKKEEAAAKDERFKKEFEDFKREKQKGGSNDPE